MNQERFARLIDLVGEAMEHGPEERDDYLVASCADDEMLLVEARALVSEAEETSVGGVTGRLEVLVESAAGAAVEEPAAHPDRIGPYEIVRPLGRGGMGVVYLARQEAPIRRNVAVKVVRRAILGPDVVARFSAERQALALMEHPGIARIFDAGTTEDGVPYFVMELVDGRPITEYCETHRMALDRRLELFGEVCDAVQHAHQRGIIHRDLKPSNVLIVDGGGRPTPKVIDFGVAKATDALLYDGSFHTRVGSLVGTLDYMSPEQIRGDPGGIDVRADVYALGVILYELVTGRHPFADTTLRRAGLLEAQRIILETEPPRPSTEPGSPRTAGGRGAATRPRAHRDLDWIVMRALEKDRERRYPSALDLVRDLQRYARDEPVSAGPPSLAYRGRKFVRRHRVGVAAAAVVALALVSGTVLAGLGFVRATAEASRAQAMSDFLTTMLASVRPEEEGRAVTVREVLDEARARLEAGEFADDLATEASLALVIGQSYEGLGRYDAAVELLEHSVELRRRLHDEDDPQIHQSLYRLGTVLWKRGDLEEALELRLGLAEMTARTVGTSHPDHAESLSNLGNTYADMGRYEDAARYLREAVEVGRRLPGEAGEVDLARFLNNLGTVYSDLEDYQAAADAFEEVLGIRERLTGETGPYAITLQNLGNARQNQADYESAEPILRRAVELKEEIYGSGHPRTASAYSALGTLCRRTGRHEEAEALGRRALEIRLATSGDNAWPVASERRRLAETLLAAGRTEEARTELEAAWAALVEAGEESSVHGREVAAEMARLHSGVGAPSEAAEWRARAQGS